MDLRKARVFALAIVIPCLAWVLVGCGLFSSVKKPVPTPKEEAISLRAQSSITPLDVFIVIDQSGSMSIGPASTDPDGRRVEAVRHFINNLALKCDPEDPHQVGIVNFGTDAPPGNTTPLTALREGEAGRLSLTVTPLDLGDTSFVRALSRVEEGFARSRTLAIGRKPVVVVFTDGEPDDERHLSRTEYFAEIKDAVNTRLAGVDIYLIAIDKTGGMWPACAPLWGEILPADHVFELRDMDTLRQKFNDIVRHLLGIPDLPPETVTASGAGFEVQPYLETLEIHAFPDEQGLELRVKRPDGQVAESGKDGVTVKDLGTYKIMVIPNPAPGKWRYEIVQGRGTITVFRNSIPVDAKLLTPATSHPLGKSVPITVSFLKKDGSPVSSVPEYPLMLSVEVTGPNLKEQAFTLDALGGGSFGAPETVPFSVPGAYRLTVTVRGGEKYSYKRTFEVKTVDSPYLTVVNPLPGSRQPLARNVLVKVQCSYHGKAVDPQEVLTGARGGMVLAQVTGQAQTEVQQSWLVVWSNGYWQASIPVPGGAGIYSLVTRLVGTERLTGRDVFDDTQVLFEVAPTLMTRLVTVGKYTGLVATAALMAWLAYYLFWRLRLKPMHGSIRFVLDADKPDAKPYQQAVNLSRHKFVSQRLGVKGGGRVSIYRIGKTRDGRERVAVKLRKGLSWRTTAVQMGDGAHLGKWMIEYR